MSRRRVGKLERSLAHAVASAWWLDSDVDRAAIDTARRCAEELDELYRVRSEQPALFGDPKAAAELMTKVAYGTTMLYAELGKLGLTPEARRSWAGRTVLDDDPIAALVAQSADLLEGPWPAEGDPDAADRDTAKP